VESVAPKSIQNCEQPQWRQSIFLRLSTDFCATTVSPRSTLLLSSWRQTAESVFTRFRLRTFQNLSKASFTPNIQQPTLTRLTITFRPSLKTANIKLQI